MKNEIKEFTGISSDFEIPKNPDIKIETNKISPREAVNVIVSYLERKEYIKLEKRN